MAKFAVWLYMKVKPGHADELLALYDELFAEFETQGHTEIYALHQSVHDPDEFWAYELFTSREEFEGEHRHTPLVQKIKPQIIEICERREFKWAEPIRAVGLDI